MLTTETSASMIDLQTFHFSVRLGDIRLGLRFGSGRSGNAVISGEIRYRASSRPCRGLSSAFVVRDGQVLARATASLAGRFALRFAERPGARLVVELPDRSVMQVDLDPLVARGSLPQGAIGRDPKRSAQTTETPLQEVA